MARYWGHGIGGGGGRCTVLGWGRYFLFYLQYLNKNGGNGGTVFGGHCIRGPVLRVLQYFNLL